MPRIVVTQQAASGIERCRPFWAAKNPLAAKRAADAIKRQIALLEGTPDIGRPFPDADGLRELLVNFGDSGYVALYRHDPVAGIVYLLAFRHQKEAGL